MVIASLPIIAAVTLLFILPGASFSATNESHPSTELLSASPSTTIKVAGEASQKIDSDQMSLILNIQTTPASLNSTSAQSKDLIQKLTNSINSALGPEESKINVGQTNLNPFYNGGGTQSEFTTFSTYSSVQIKTDIEHYNTLSSKLTDAGFRIEGISIKEVPTDTSKTVTEKISIPQGSSTPSSPPYYVPDSMTIKSGTTVIWTNEDSAAHTVTSGSPSNGPDGSFDSGLFMSGNTFEYQFNSEGDYPYFCQVHPWMTGQIIVTKGNNTGPTPQETTYQVSMNVIVETQPDTIKNSIKSYQEKFDSLKKVLDDAGVAASSIKSNQINFNPIYYGQAQFTTYNAYTRLTVNTDVKNTEKLLSAVKMPGVNVETITFSVSDSALDKIRKDLTQKALDSAMERANDIAEPAGLKIKAIKSIEVNPNPTPQYQNTFVYRGVSLGQVDGSIYQMGQTSVNVLAEFELGK